MAQLHRLVEAGEHFSDEAMRARAPLLHFHYIAQVMGRDIGLEWVGCRGLPYTLHSIPTLYTQYTQLV